jgi:hypothetical protein
VTSPSVSVVVLSYNRPERLGAALRSIHAQSRGPFETLVIDNPSEASPEIARVVKATRHARLVALDENVGFAGGMNEGASRVSGDLVLFTEDDILLAPDCLSRLADGLLSTPGASLVAPVMFNLEAGTVRCAGGHVTLGRSFGFDVFTAIRSHEPYPVNFVPGAVFCMRRREFDEIGGLRRDFFMYLEDCELCLRLVAAGRGVYVVPDAHVRHFEPPAGAAPPEVEFHKQKNLLALYTLHASPALAARRWASCAADIVRLQGLDRTLRRRALGWNLRHAPGLVRDRWRLRPGVGPGFARQAA